MDSLEVDQKQARPGQAAVFDGILQVRDPGPDTPAALIAPGEGILLKVNGKQVAQGCRVYERDEIELQTMDFNEPARLEVSISSGGMSAEAQLFPARRITYTIEEQQFSEQLTISAVRHEEPLNEYDLDGLKTALAEAGVHFGIDEEALARLPVNLSSRTVVATGIPPVNGHDGRVEFFFEEGRRQVQYDEQETRVDFRERYEICQVNEGDLIACIHPPLPGEPGKAVTGATILPAQVRAARVRCDLGTALSADGRQVLATRKGIPVYKKGPEKLFRVEDIYLHKGDIDIKSGNASFRGHLKITGGIAEGMKVLADGEVEVAGDASGATIKAGGGIFIKKSCIKSQLHAGWIDLLVKDIQQKILEITENTGRLIEAHRELLAVLEERGQDHQQKAALAMKILIQNKFSGLPAAIGQLQCQLREPRLMLPEQILNAAGGLAGFIQNCLDDRPFELPLLNAQHGLLLEVLAYFQESRSNKAGITVFYVQNSNLSCTGDIAVTGPGAYNSNFKCGGEVRVARVFRGGNIEAGGHVYIGKVGSPRFSGIQCTIAVPRDCSIYMNMVYENTLLKIGPLDYVCSSTVSRVRFCLDQASNEIKAFSWK